MRVVLLHYTAPPVVGGVETVLACQARLLADAGHEVTIVAARGRTPDRRVRFARVPRADTRHPDVLAAQAALDAGAVPSGFARLRSSLEAALRAAVVDTDVLIAHNVCSLHKNLALTAALHRLNGMPRMPRLVAWHHDLAWTAARYQAQLHPGEPWDLLRRVWPGVAHVAVSDDRRASAAELFGLDPTLVSVIPNGLDRDAFLGLGARTRALLAPLALADAAPILFLPARIAPRKNIELAVRVLAELRAAGDDARLLVTGAPDPHDPASASLLRQLRSLRSRLGLENAAHFLAEDGKGLAEPVVADLYRVADALFLPSRDEGFGLPVLEAAVSRLPVFCADLPAVRAIAGTAATYFAADADPAAVARIVRSRLAADPAYELAVRARRRYDWQRIYREQIGPLLERVTAGVA